MSSVYNQFSESRKKEQSEGTCPEWFTTAGYQLFKDKYLYQADNIKSQYTRIAKAAAKHLRKLDLDEDAEKKFFDLMWNGYLSLSTPVLANMGTDRGMPVSCSGGDIQDSIRGFYDARREVAILTKNGFGTSGYMGNIRPRGSDISVGGKSSGVLPVFKGFIQDMRDVAQGTARRGAFAAYIEIDHGDFDELADFVASEPDDANIGWVLTDDYLQKLKEHDGDSVRRFQKALKLKMITGKGYFFKVGAVNRNRPVMYKDKELMVLASNLCFAGSTMVAVGDGRNAVSIKQLAEESNGVDTFPVFCATDKKKTRNGTAWSEPELKQAIAFKTGTRPIIKLLLSDGSSFECTANHRIAGSNGDWIEAKDALGLETAPFFTYTSIDDKNAKYRFINSISYPAAKQSNHVWQYNNGTKPNGMIVDHVHPTRETSTGNNDRIDNLQLMTKNDHLKKLGDEMRENNPMFGELTDECRENMSIAATGSLNPTYSGISNMELIEYGKRAKLSLGVETFGRKEYNKMTEMFRKPFPKSFSNYRFGGSRVDYYAYVNGVREYDGAYDIETRKCTAATYPMTEARQAYIRENFMFTSGGMTGGYSKKMGLTVVEIIDENKTEDVYDLTVEDNHNFFIITKTDDENYENCSGLLVHNCQEINLFADKKHTFTCVLASMNVAKYNLWKDTDAVFWATVFLDCVAEEFIQKAKDVKGLEKAVRFTEKGRALGLGQCGFHTFIQANSIPFESLGAHYLNTEIAKHINEKQVEATKWMAVKLGEPEWCKGYGVRNTHLSAIAPTKSTALIMGGVSEGINPDPAHVFTQTTAGGEMERISPIFLKLLKERGHFNKPTLKGIIDKFGSVQHLEWLSEHEKDVFKTAFEINQEIVIRLAANRQKYVCQGQSLNLFFSADEDPAWISHCHKQAFENEGILGLYYITTMAGVHASKECEACQ